MKLLLDALKRTGLEPTAEELADLVWLATYMAPDPLADSSAAQTKTPSLNKPLPSENKPRSAAALIKRGGRLSAFADSVLAAPAGETLPFRSPSAAALPGVLGLERALRPLMRRIASRTQEILDEEATVERIAEERIAVPAMRSHSECWLEIALLVDESASMTIWRQTVRELRQMLERHGAFRDVQTWGLVTPLSSTSVALYAGSPLASGAKRSLKARVRHPNELIEPTGRRLLLILSDCVAPAWHDGRMARLLAHWTTTCPLALVQMLPRRLWNGTGLRHAQEVFLHAPQLGVSNLGVSNSRLIREYTFERDDLPKPTLLLPALTLEPEAFISWTRMLAGRGDAWTPGVLLPLTAVGGPSSGGRADGATAETSSLTPEMRLRRFYAMASPTAQQLTACLSAVHLTLPVMRLVQRAMLPESLQIHLAEVFLSGLLKQLSPEAEAGAQLILEDLEQMDYDFHAGVREQLLSGLPPTFAEQVRQGVTAYVSHKLGQTPGFAALLADPSTVAATDETRFPFAFVTVQALKRLGGRYAEVALRLELASYITNSIGMEFVLISAGTFQMGMADGGEWERPEHSVRISQPFYLGKYPVTQAQWATVMGNNPSMFKGHPDWPVENVSWEDVNMFIQTLKAREGREDYRLPTEAEWEYACRAGSTSSYCFGDDPHQLGEYAWYRENAGGQPHPVGLLKPNVWELYDMHGNVWEWVQDWYRPYPTAPLSASPSLERVDRGGSWVWDARFCRSATRGHLTPGHRAYDTGFRLLLEAR